MVGEEHECEGNDSDFMQKGEGMGWQNNWDCLNKEKLNS